ncbi:MBL fold metallo-hydrolase [Marihabitans asiaticum]|uniref:Glyoxylase-like metal-dependent hydrolase (Beta-lactamase superfamily II) n=1 Tax=Marihabitans asiaticum TaxID=415218 RepID=A0A560WDZ0_9MICO|nr:MBL fold metallo-hydrolase [Marihabitans asiaticum]TWD15744.1 glyoxylase-like metal-dependent hydrolase (beta-lactamase superfamily II) [Marihabitans asiaticum]
MSGAAHPPSPSAAVGEWAGGQITEHAHCLLQGNPGPMTLDGTNTWVVMAPGSSSALVIDPGEDDEAHQQRVLDHVASRDARITQIVLTHGHGDHSEGAPRLARLTAAPVVSAGRGGDLGHGDVLDAGGVELSVVATPGHTADSLSFALAADHALLTGDTVLGRGTTVVAHPDGELEAYLSSLETISRLTGDGAVSTILPGHGPTVPDAAAMVGFYRRHRRERLDQVRQAVADGARDADEVVASVYADVDRSVWPAARLSVLAQLTYLRRRG